MLYKIAIASLVLPLSVFATVLNVNVYATAEDNKAGHQRDQVVLDDPKSDDPAWKGRDDLHLVPLLPEARTGVIPVDIEEALIAALGPRFANEFIKVGLESGWDNDTALTAGCGLACAGTLIKAAPCIAAAVACKCIAPIIACPTVSIGDLCNCVSCLPQVIEDLLKKLGICTKSLLDGSSGSKGAKDDSLSYGSFISYSIRDANLLAYRGDLPKTTLEEAKAVAKGGICPGHYCSDSVCCLGLCLPDDKCLGKKLELGGNTESRHLEL
ncbi:hypothetical protein FBEOM_7452 [Fusarium beomiforme]|uniref:Uncharacterized protein n=1 Tax=Fusarium beomiforme TaxID=44412 RepID=A0A9P5DX19_9HYPO|nr:hypothetical protein FBEOM_7452 [Fusarium beomiforme]